MCVSFVKTFPQDQREGTHVELETQLLKPSGHKWLSKHIIQLIRTRNEADVQVFIINTITKKVEINFHMIGTSMKNWIDRHVGSPNIIAPKCWWRR
jgi:serine protease inhibitor ecotin